MIILPQKLFESEHVSILLRDGNTCILEKSLPQSFLNRQGYISNHVISVVIKGKQIIKSVDEETFHVNPGEILFIPRGLYYVTDLIPENGNFQSILFYFDNKIIEEYLSKSKVTSYKKEPSATHLKFKRISEIDTYINSLLSIYKNKNARNKSFLDLKILELLHLINGLVGDQNFTNFLFQLSLPTKRNIKTFMQQNFDKPLKIEDYAYLTGRSQSSFRRDFKTLFDTTPHQWLKKQRLVKAVKLIENGSTNVTNLSFDVGYENISYFIQEFKNHTGHSPKQYILKFNKGQLLN